MSLSKISDEPHWQRITERVSERVMSLQSSPVSETMARLQTSQAAIQRRKGEIEAALAAMTSTATEKKTNWQAALEGNDSGALLERDQLRKEYRSLEETERFNEAAIEEGRLEQDRNHGKVSLDTCIEIKPDYLRAVVPKARAAARQLVEVMMTEQRIVDELLRNGIRVDHLGRVSFPVSRHTLEAFLHETAELG
jgi:hypothetical protein